MKKMLISLLSVLTTLISFAQTVGDAVYVYRNDGDFNAFFRENIDSITYSNYDVDGNNNDDIMTQLIYTKDSVYRIPLAAVDSMSFVNPEIIYQPDVVLMDENMLQYLQTADDLTLTFNSTIPEDLRPQSGQVLFSSTYKHPLLDGVFVGRVKSTRETNDGILVECEEVADITDVVVRLVGIERLEDIANQASTRSLSDIIEIEKKKKDFNLEISEEFGEDNGISALGKFHMSYRGEAAYMIDLFNRIIDVKLYHDWQYSIDFDFKLEKKLEWPEDNSVFIRETLPLPLAGGILEVRAEVSPFFKTNAEVEIKGKYQSPNLSYLTHIKYDKDQKIGDEDMPYYGTATKELSSDRGDNKGTFDGEVTLKGTIKFGEHLGFSLGTPKRIGAYTKANMDIDMGIKVEGDINIKGSTDKNTFYNTLKDCKLEFGPVVDFEIIGEAKTWSSKPYKKTVFEKEILLKNYYYERYLLPKFSDLKISKDVENRSITISTKPSRDLIVSFPVGVGIYDSKNNLIGPKYESKEYQMETDDLTIEQSFSSLSINEDYTAMPMINFLFDIPATPTQRFKLEGDLPKIISCKMGEAQFTTDGYILSEINSEATYECKDGETGWGLAMIAIINGEKNLVGQSDVIPPSQKEAINPKMSFAGATTDFNMDYDTFTATWIAGPIQVVPFIDSKVGSQIKRNYIYDAAVPFEDQIIYKQEPILAFRNAKITSIDRDDDDAISNWETEYGLLGSAWLERIELMKQGSDFISTNGGWALDDFMDGLNTIEGKFTVLNYHLSSLLGNDLNVVYYMKLNLCNGTTRLSDNCMKFKNNDMYITGVEVVDLPNNLKSASTRSAVPQRLLSDDNETWQKIKRTNDFMKSSVELLKEIKRFSDKLE